MECVNIAIRADGSAKIGMGHLMRCLSIALVLQEKHVKVLFITKHQQSKEFVVEKGFDCEILSGCYENMEAEIEETLNVLSKRNIQLLLVDSYQATEEYLARLNAVIPVFYLDDLGRMGLPVSGLINYNIYGKKMGYESYYPINTKLLLGSSYAPVKAAFRNTPYRVRDEVSNILITMGGSDFLNIAGQLGKALVHVLPQDITLTLVCGRFSPHLEAVRTLAKEVPERIQVLTDVSNMWDVMQRCDLAIAAAGSTMYELCTMGIPTICCYYVENQRRMAECFGQETSMLNAGDFSANPEQVLSKITAHVLTLTNDLSMRMKLAAEMQKVSDGVGAWRIAEILQEFSALK